MEGAPIIPEAPKAETEKDSESDKNKKKRRGIFERPPEAEKKDEKDKRRGLFELASDNPKPERTERKKDHLAEASAEKPITAEAAKEQAAEAVQNEVEAAPEAEAPIEAVSPEEQKVVLQELAKHEMEANQASAPDVEEDPQAAAEALASERFMQAVAEHGDIEAAKAEAAADAGATPEEIVALNQPTPEQPLVEAPAEGEAEIMDEQVEEVEEGSAEQAVDLSPEEPKEFGDEELILDRSAETTAEDGEDEDGTAATKAAAAGAAGGTAAAAATHHAAGGGGTGTGGTSTGGPGGGGRPPFGPGGPHGPSGPGGGFQGPGFNAMPAPAAANTANTLSTPDMIDDQANPAAMALFGGIIGYLIGRRRGRIKAERKFKPVKRKYEKQVESLQFNLREQDKKIRQLAREKAQQQGPEVVEVLAAKTAAVKAERADKPPTIIERVVKQQIEKQPKPRVERVRAPEAHQLHGSPIQEKHIGQMLMAAEAPALVGKRNEKSPQKITAEQSARPLTERRVETLNRSELLSLSEKIIVEGSSLRQIYETKLVGEHGLRRLVAEYMRGGDIKKALRQEIVEREIDFERDPDLRDMAPGGLPASGGGSSGQAALEKMLAGAKVPGVDASQEAAYYQARAAYEARQAEQHNSRKVVDVAMTTIILLLVGLVTFLIVTRG